MSAVAPPPVDLTMSSLRVLAEREHIGERVTHPAPIRPTSRARLRPLLGLGVLLATLAGLARVWRGVTTKRRPLRRLLAAR